MNVAIIPARGGSKRIPKKNIKEFCGKPIIVWSIEAAIKSSLFDKVIVSTDDQEIAEIARKWGAIVPFIRPDYLSDDQMGTAPVIRHAISHLYESGMAVDYVCCIYATAPFIKIEDLKVGLRALLDSSVNYAFSVTKFDYPIQRALRITDMGLIEMVQPDCLLTRSQDLEEYYHDAAQFYWGRSHAWVNDIPVMMNNAHPIIIPSHRSQDIDSLEDWIKAEILFKAMKSGATDNV